MHFAVVSHLVESSPHFKAPSQRTVAVSQLVHILSCISFHLYQMLQTAVSVETVVMLTSHTPCLSHSPNYVDDLMSTIRQSVI